MTYNVLHDELDVEREHSRKVGFGSRGREFRILSDEPSLEYWEGE